MICRVVRPHVVAALALEVKPPLHLPRVLSSLRFDRPRACLSSPIPRTLLRAPRAVPNPPANGRKTAGLFGAGADNAEETLLVEAGGGESFVGSKLTYQAAIGLGTAAGLGDQTDQFAAAGRRI